MNRTLQPGHARCLLLACLLGAPLLASSANAPVAPAAQGEAARIERLSANVRNITAIRATKRLQSALNHYREAGLWEDAAQLFTRDASAQVGEHTYNGPRQIGAFLQAQALAGTGPRPAG